MATAGTPSDPTYVVIQSGGGSGTASAVTIADGANVTQGAKGDAVATDTGSWTLVSLTKAVYSRLAGTLTISAASLPLPAGASTETTLGAVNTKLGGTLAVSAASLPLPAGASQDGTDPTTPVVTNSGAGIRGWLATIAGLLKLGAMAKASSGSVTIATDQGNLEPGGTPITGTTLAAGGVGLTGWLSAIWQGATTRVQVFADAAAASLAASATSANSIHSIGSSPIPWTRFNALFSSNQAGTWVIEGSNNNFATAVLVTSGTLSANVTLTQSVPIIFAYYRAYITNGTTAATVTVMSSFTAS